MTWTEVHQPVIVGQRVLASWHGSKDTCQSPRVRQKAPAAWRGPKWHGSKDTCQSPWVKQKAPAPWHGPKWYGSKDTCQSPWVKQKAPATWLGPKCTRQSLLVRVLAGWHRLKSACQIFDSDSFSTTGCLTWEFCWFFESRVDWNNGPACSVYMFLFCCFCGGVFACMHILISFSFWFSRCYDQTNFKKFFQYFPCLHRCTHLSLFVCVNCFFCIKNLKQNEAQSADAESTHKGVNQHLKYATQVQQRPESPTVTLTWHACKYKVNKLH